MEYPSWFLTETTNLQQAINAEYMPTLTALLNDHQISGQVLNFVQMAHSEAPDPLTPDVMMERSVYSNRAAIEQQMKEAAETDYLIEVGSHTYQLTDAGLALAREIVTAVEQNATDISVLPDEQALRLVGYLDRLRQAALDNDQLDKPCLSRSVSFDQGDRSPIAERVRRRLNDLTAFRDDAHIASWAQHGVSGAVWDAFSHVWGETVYGDPVQTAEQLAEKLSFHGYSAEERKAHLQSAVQKGWLSEQDGVYTVTDAGNTMRRAAEERTDELFYSGWALSEEELTDLQQLMQAWVSAAAPPENNALYQRLKETRTAITSLYRDEYITRIEAEKIPGWGPLLLMHASAQAPAPITPQTLQSIVPYMTVQRLSERLQESTATGHLEASENGYTATDKGKRFLDEILKLATNALAEPIGVANGRLDAIATLLSQMRDSFHDAAEPADKPALCDTAHFAAERPPLHKASRAIAEMIAFRDDTHVAAFQKYDVPAHQWEAFSHVWGENVWGDEVETAEQVSEKLAFRGHSKADYRTALQNCVDRGWLTVNDDGVYTVTEQGRAVRGEAEQETNRLFFTPWQQFAPRHIKWLYDELAQLNGVLAPSE